MYNIRKLYKKIKKLEKKNKNYIIIGLNKHEIISTDKGSIFMRDNLVKLPLIYNYLKDIQGENKIKDDLLKIIGE